MYQIKEWSEDLDLSEFYSEALRRGFINNSSQQLMVDCFRKEKDWKVWLLYHNDKVVGSVGAHSLPELGPNSYRICARTCVFTDMLDGVYGKNLRTLSVITEHQNPTAQFFIPKCIEYCGLDSDMYISSHPSDVGTQKRVHTVYCPSLEKLGTLTRTRELMYRGHLQTFWKLNSEVFLTQLNSSPRWI